MLGYAETPADLRLGRTVSELHTGDVARRTAAGLYELVGRRSRFVKLFGLRIDPHRIEAMLDEHGMTACCVGGDEELVVAVRGDGDATAIRRLVAGAAGLSARAVRVCFLPELPRLPTGKLDHVAAARLATPTVVPAPEPNRQPADVRAVFAEVLERTDVTDDSTFVGLGGDSLSYVEMSLRLEQALGHLPADWHTTRVADLRPAASARTGRRRCLETSVALRAVAIVLIVGSHIGLLDLPGGAHVLLGVAGFNFARFHLTDADRRRRTGHLAASTARIVAPSVAWIALVFLLTDNYDLANLFLLNTFVGPHVGTEVYFWFVESLVWILIAALALLAVPALDRAERRWPFALPMGLMTVALVARYDLPMVDAALYVPVPFVALWLFALGWAAAKATSRWQRLAVSVAIVATVPGYFDKPLRETIVIGGLLLLVWVSSVPGTRSLNRVAAALAGSSLYIYLTHWHVYPYLQGFSPLLALLASLAVGILYALVVARALAGLCALRARRRGAAPDPAPPAR
jgi:hypothetical protein